VNEFTVQSGEDEINITDGKVRLDVSNQWQVTAINLPEKDGSDPITYTWEEVVNTGDNIDKYYKDPEYSHTSED